MYFNEQETQHPIISTGDYKDREAMLHRQDRVWYFAYGSNMDVARMLTRNAPFTRRIKGRVGGHRLVFNKISGKYPGHGVANVIEEWGFDVVGVLYEVDRPGIEALDGHEGVRGGHYIRTEMMVQLDDGTAVNANVYVAHPDMVEEGLTPHEDYFYHLKQGIDILGEGGTDYLKQALVEARISGDGRFLSEQDLPRVKEDDSEFDIETMALPVLINGFKSKIFLRDDLWSTRVIFSCDPADVQHFRDMGLNVAADGSFGTNEFQFIRKGILEVVFVRLVVELDR
jgi:cation transport regulator ChaC